MYFSNYYTNTVRYRLSKDRAIKIIRLTLPLYLAIFHQLKSERDGELIWPPWVIEEKNNLKAHNYVVFYDDDKTLSSAMNLAFFGHEGLEEVKVMLETEGFDKLHVELDNILDEIVSTSKQLIETISHNANLLEDEKKDSAPSEADIKQYQYFFLAFQNIFHNIFSIMVFGERLSKLVQKAIAGDDKALLKAIKIDKNLIHDHPYFKEKFYEANRRQDKAFHEAIIAKQATPSLKGRIQHKGLYAMFFLLDMLEVLDDFSNKELYALYESCELTKYETPPYELSSFARHLKKFKQSR